jgi:hypothetical protein
MNYDLKSNGNLIKNIQAAADLLRSDHCHAERVRKYTNMTIVMQHVYVNTRT